jgi:hypothetical protein
MQAVIPECGMYPSASVARNLMPVSAQWVRILEWVAIKQGYLPRGGGARRATETTRVVIDSGPLLSRQLKCHGDNYFATNTGIKQDMPGCRGMTERLRYPVQHAAELRHEAGEIAIVKTKSDRSAHHA